MTTREKLELKKVMDRHNADALAALKELDEEVARRRARMNPAIGGWKVRKVQRTRAELAEIEARMSKPLTRAERKKRDHDREVLRLAYELDARAYAPTPIQQRLEIAITLIWMWTQKKVTA